MLKQPNLYYWTSFYKQAHTQARNTYFWMNWQDDNKVEYVIGLTRERNEAPKEEKTNIIRHINYNYY